MLLSFGGFCSLIFFQKAEEGEGWINTVFYWVGKD